MDSLESGSVEELQSVQDKVRIDEIDEVTIGSKNMNRTNVAQKMSIFTPNSTTSNNKVQYFSDLKKNIHEMGAGVDLIYETIEQNIEAILAIHSQVQTLLSDYNVKLLKVLERHEQDFLSAYKAHMTKVEKELHYLKGKAKDQESRLAQDERLLKYEKQLLWFKEEYQRLIQQREENENEIDRLNQQCKRKNDHKKFMEDQIKAQKRQNKLLLVALNKSQQQRNGLSFEAEEIDFHLRETKKQQVVMPYLGHSPFMTVAESNSGVNFDQVVQTERMNESLIREKENKARSLYTTTEFQSDLNTSRIQQLVRQELDAEKSHQTTQFANTEYPIVPDLPSSSLNPTILQKYILDLEDSGRTEEEIIEGVEQYYNKLCFNNDADVMMLQEEIEKEKAISRQIEAEELVLPASELEDFSNFFLDCVYAERKSLRQQLVTMRQTGNKKDYHQRSLLETYMKTVRTGSQEEIEQFSQVEKQKLVQLLVTNTELLNFMFDKMFKNKQSGSSNQLSSGLQTMSRGGQEQQDLYQSTYSKGQGEEKIEMQNTDLAHMLINNDNSAQIDSQLKQSMIGSKRISSNMQNQPIQSNYLQQMKKQVMYMPHGSQQENKFKDKKQKSMIVGYNEQSNSQSINDAYFSASPLLFQPAQRDHSLAKNQQSNNLLQRIKESNFNSNMLSQIDTDILQQQYISQQNTFLNLQSPKTEMHNQSQMFPDINKQSSVMGGEYLIQNADESQKLRSRSYKDGGTSNKKSLMKRLRNSVNNKPVITVKNGKLLIINKQS